MAPKLEVDGHEPSAAELRDAVMVTFGHFTALQVRGGRTRGLSLHLERLDAANRELFGEALGGERVRELIRHALVGGSGDASVRVIVRGAGAGPGVRIFVSVAPPFELSDRPQRLKSAPYQRPIAHIKRPGDFAQGYFIDRAKDAGYDDALLVATDGTISESGIANIAFFDGDSVIWPDGPQLAGITMQLVAPRLAEHGVPSRTARVTLADVSGFAGACVTNSRGIAPVDQVDDVTLPIAPAFVKALNAAYESVPWDAV